jgi:threonine dehydrogenase-like Zn-dependent dehydrogenase
VNLVAVAGGENGGQGLFQAMRMTRPGGTIANVAYFSTGDT